MVAVNKRNFTRQISNYYLQSFPKTGIACSTRYSAIIYRKMLLHDDFVYGIKNSI